jgi:deazaflavin-dependent oxidoreductase (nitroreductase family)
MSVNVPEGLAGERNGYLTTTGRKTGERHTVEIWFGLDQETVYLLTGRQGKTNWLRNLTHDPRVGFRIAGHEYVGEGRLVTDPEEGRRLRELMVAKYKPIVTGWDIDAWGQAPIMVAVELKSEAASR